MFCQHCSNNLCTTVSLVDIKPHFFQHCQIVYCLMEIGVSLRGVECESSGHDQVLLLFRIADSDIQTTFPSSTSATSYFSVEGNYASSTRRALACFFSQTTNLLAGQFAILRKR